MGIDPQFRLDEEKCVGCGLCTKVCEGLMLHINANGKVEIADNDAWNGRGCWGCQHCMAVCPKGAISINGKDPDLCATPPGREIADLMDALILTRRSFRRYIDKPVDQALVQQLMRIMGNVPTGGNRQGVEYTVVTDPLVMKQLHDVVYTKMEENAAAGKLPSILSSSFYSFLKESEKTVRPDDLLFCSAPNLFIAHQEVPEGSVWGSDKALECAVTTAYFELLCAAHGLGAVIMSTPVGVFEMIPESYDILGIPRNHVFGLVVGFGYPEITYKRGVQREDGSAVHEVHYGYIDTYGRVGGHFAPDESLD
ncbi:MAG: nitroreductase family protein [Lachnospiraceae bacterium]|nr:nitroreductase family protein [Lachnospiraceae bacterium]